jgi:hypothetical protein
LAKSSQTQVPPNLVDDSFQVGEDVDIPEPNNTESTRREIGRSGVIRCLSLRIAVMPAVELNDDALLSVTCKVRDVVANLNLSAEVIAFWF